MTTLLEKIVTPRFIAAQAHIWFAYALVFTFPNGAVVLAALVAAGVKEFYIDPKYELGQTVADDIGDFAGYVAGISLAIIAHAFGL